MYYINALHGGISMPKLSVYVPDELWNAVRETIPSENASQLVQSGLRALVGSTEELPASFTAALSRPHPALEAVRVRLLDEALEGFRLGYEIGMERLATGLPWQMLDRMSEYDFDLLRLSEDGAADRIDAPAGEHAWEGWGDWAWTQLDIGEAERGYSPRFGKTFHLGIRLALRDVWEAVARDLGHRDVETTEDQ